jgi:cytochrome P450
MVDLTNEMLETEWRPPATRDLFEDFKLLTLRIVVSALFGNSGKEGMDEVVPAITAAFEFFQRRATSMMIGELSAFQDTNAIFHMKFV